MSRKDILVPFFIFMIAFSVRLVYLNQIKTSPLFIPSEATIDEYLYHSWAKDIAFQDPIGKEAFWGLPLYPYFLGFVYSIFGPNVYIAKLIQFLLGSLSCVLLYFIGKKIFNRPVGIISGLGLSLYNAAIFHEGFLISSALAVFLNCLLILSVLLFSEKPGYKRAVIAGAILGLVSLTSPSIFLFIPFLFLLFSRHLKLILISLFVCGLVILPVTIRNYVLEKDFVLITTHSGITFYTGNNPTANGLPNLPPALGTDISSTRANSKAIAERAMQRRLKPSEVSGFWFGKGVEFIREDPFRYLKLLCKKFLLFWNHHEISDVTSMDFFKRFAWVLKLPLVNYTVISTFSMLGLFLAFGKRNKAHMLLYFILLANAISMMVYFVNARYRLPIIPVLILFASYCMYYICKQALAKKYNVVLLCSAALIPSYFIGSIRMAKTSMETFYTNMGVFYTEKKMYDKAIGEFNRAIEENPAYPFAHINLGYLYLDKKMNEEAAREFKKSIELLPDYALAHNNLAIAYKRLGMADEAIREYSAATELDPGFADAYYNLGLLYFENGRFADALKNFEKVLSINPNYAGAEKKIASCREVLAGNQPN